MIGVPVVGGPLVLDFPTSPPLALAGGIRDGEMWLDGAALASDHQERGCVSGFGAGAELRYKCEAGSLCPGVRRP